MNGVKLIFVYHLHVCHGRGSNATLGDHISIFPFAQLISFENDIVARGTPLFLKDSKAVGTVYAPIFV